MKDPEGELIVRVRVYKMTLQFLSMVAITGWYAVYSEHCIKIEIFLIFMQRSEYAVYHANLCD